MTAGYGLADLKDSFPAQLERALIANVLRLRETTADDVMVPRADIVAMRVDVTLEQANAQMKLAGQQFLRRYPTYNAKNSFAVQPLRDFIVSDVRSSLFVLLGAVGFVLLDCAG